MRHRITIEKKTRGTSDNAGGYVSETWSTVATVWAKLDPKSSREIIDADQVVHRVSHVIMMRARDDVTAAMRVDFQGRKMAILSVRTILENGRWIEMLCEESAPS
jgi:SPP1 family predicted phage head-tail adaptor